MTNSVKYSLAQSVFTLLLLLPAGESLSFWTQLGQKINGEENGDRFGWSSALSKDGTVVAVGADETRYRDGSGYVRVFRYTEKQKWEQVGQDIAGKAVGDNFGNSLAMSADGNIVAAGARFHEGNGVRAAGQVQIFQYDSGQWNQIGQGIDGVLEDDKFGDTVALSWNGNIVATAGLANSGRVVVFGLNESTKQWGQLGHGIHGEAGGDRFGATSLAMSADGVIVAAGARGNDERGSNSGHVRVVRYNSAMNEWEQLGQDIDGYMAGDGFGRSVALSADGKIVVAGAPSYDETGSIPGYVLVFEYNDEANQWKQLGQDIVGEEAAGQFGRHVAMSADGKIVAVGAVNSDGNGVDSGHVCVFQYDGTRWNQLGQDIDGEAARDLLGRSVDLSADGTVLAVGAPHRCLLNNYLCSSSGYVRVFRNGIA